MEVHYHVVAAIIQHKGKILCTQKGPGKYDYISYKYEFPGGKVEVGETVQAALHREIKEEIRLDIAVGERYKRSEEHTSELQSRENLVCRLLLEKKNNTHISSSRVTVSQIYYR